MPQKRLTTNGNVFKRTDGRWQSVIWYFDEQGVKRRKVFSSKTKTEAQQKITTYIAQFNEEVRSSDESQKTIKESLTRWLQVFKFPSVERTTYDRLECTAMYRPAPGVPADWRENRRGYNSSRPEIRPQLLDGPGLRLHHSEESPHSAQRVFPLPHRVRLHSEEPYAIGTDDEESQLLCRPR